MGPGGGLVLVVLLVASVCPRCESRTLGSPDVSAVTTDALIMSGYESGRRLDRYERTRRMCVLCEQFTGQAMEYLKENRTQAEILDAFHHACLRLHSFQQQCSMMVDYYAPLFFLEVALVRPHDFCRKVSLCEDAAPPPPPPASPLAPPAPSPSPPVGDHPLKGERICGVCNNTVSSIIARLKDPGTELKIVEGLVKGCVVTDNFAEKCQNLIFQYGPVILTSVVRVLERADVCVALHACRSDRNEETAMHAFVAAPVLAQLPLLDM